MQGFSAALIQVPRSFRKSSCLVLCLFCGSRSLTNLDAIYFGVVNGGRVAQEGPLIASRQQAAEKKQGSKKKRREIQFPTSFISGFEDLWVNLEERRLRVCHETRSLNF